MAYIAGMVEQAHHMVQHTPLLGRNPLSKETTMPISGLFKNCK